MRAPPRVTLGHFRDVVDIYDDSSDPTDEQLAYVGLPEVADVPCQVEHVGGHEKEQTTFTKYEVVMHYLDNITAAMQVVVTQGDFSGESLNIGEVEVIRNHGRPKYLRLHCQKIE